MVELYSIELILGVFELEQQILCPELAIRQLRDKEMDEVSVHTSIS